MNRRQFLGGVAAASTTALAGCSGVLGNSPEFGAASDPWSNDNDTQLETGYEYSGAVTLGPNKYAQINLSPSLPWTLRVRADATKPMDIYTIDQNEFNRYRDGEEFQTVTGALAEDTTTPQFSAQLNAGEWYVIFDNTDVATMYDGEVSADYTVRGTA